MDNSFIGITPKYTHSRKSSTMDRIEYSIIYYTGNQLSMCKKIIDIKLN